MKYDPSNYPYGAIRGPGQPGYSRHSKGLSQAADFQPPVGVDLAAPLLGAEPWVVAISEDRGSESYGQWVQLERGGRKVRYAHLDSRHVHRGDVVPGGCLIGVSGNSGGSSGPHLHYEDSGDLWASARYIWKVVTHLTNQDRAEIAALITDALNKQNTQLLNAFTVGAISEHSLGGTRKQQQTVVARVKNNNIKALR